MPFSKLMDSRTEEEFGALVAANYEKARPFVYMSDSESPYESEVDNGLRTPESRPSSPKLRAPSTNSTTPKLTAPTSSKQQPHRVEKHKLASRRYPRTRSRPCDHVWLDHHKKNIVNYKPFFGKLIRCSFSTYAREYDPERQDELWGHLTPAQRRERQFRKDMDARGSASYIILPGDKLKIFSPPY